MPDTMTKNPKVEALIGQIEMTSKLFASDIRAMPHETLAANLGGKSRTGYDVVFEVAWLNQAIADQAQGKPFDFEEPKGWMKAPAEFCAHENALTKFENSVADLKQALSTADQATLDKVVQSPMGPTPVLDIAGIVPGHIMYHSGQLNFIQTVQGDDAFHWM